MTRWAGKEASWATVHGVYVMKDDKMVLDKGRGKIIGEKVRLDRHAAAGHNAEHVWEEDCRV